MFATRLGFINRTQVRFGHLRPGKGRTYVACKWNRKSERNKNNNKNKRTRSRSHYRAISPLITQYDMKLAISSCLTRGQRFYSRFLDRINAFPSSHAQSKIFLSFFLFYFKTSLFRCHPSFFGGGGGGGGNYPN